MTEETKSNKGGANKDNSKSNTEDVKLQAELKLDATAKQGDGIHTTTIIKASGSNIITGRYDNLTFAAWYSEHPARKGIDCGIVYRLIVWKGERPDKDNVLASYNEDWAVAPTVEADKAVEEIIRYCEETQKKYATGF